MPGSPATQRSGTPRFRTDSSAIKDAALDGIRAIFVPIVKWSGLFCGQPCELGASFLALPSARPGSKWIFRGPPRHFALENQLMPSSSPGEWTAKANTLRFLQS